MSPLTILPRLRTVLVMLDVAGRQVGLPVASVLDVVKAQRAGPGRDWRVHRGPGSAVCPPGMLAVGDRCIPLVELAELLGTASRPVARRLRSAVIVQAGEHTMGLLVDTVADIVEAPCSAIRKAVPADGLHLAVQQVVRLGGREIEVLDIDRLLDPPRRRASMLKLR